MPEYILLMHDDAPGSSGDWEGYLARLRASGRFQGGSAIGPGRCLRRDGEVRPTSDHLTGYLRVDAADIDAAAHFLEGNPHFEAGGTVEIRLLPRDE